MSTARHRAGASRESSELQQLPPQTFSVESEDGQSHPLLQWVGSVLDYKTDKVVRIQHRWLGIGYTILCITIICYVLFDQMLWLSMHQVDQGGVGSTIIRFSGKGCVSFSKLF